MGLHGYARYTADIDFWYKIDLENAKRLLRVLQLFGIDDLALTLEALLTPGRIFRMGWPPLRIELLNKIDGVEFDACYEQRNMVTVDGIEIPVISRDDLLANKRASRRPKISAMSMDSKVRLFGAQYLGLLAELSRLTSRARRGG